MKIGSHVSNNGDLMLAGSVIEALEYNSNCFMIYLGSPQTTLRKSFDKYNVDIMKKGLNEFNIDIKDCIVHAPYIVNLANPDLEKQSFAVSFITSELKTLKTIGFKYLVLHPGNHLNEGIEVGINRIAHNIKKIFENTEGDDTYIALETMSGKGSEVCFRFEHIKQIMDIVSNERLVVCLDTCHIHDAGYDIVNNYQSVIEEFDKIVGLDKLRVIHLNDSKNVCGAKKDRHENIGFGAIGFDCLMNFVNDFRFNNIPIILETPYVNDLAPYKYEIEMIKNKIFNPNLLNLIKGE